MADTMFPRVNVSCDVPDCGWHIDNVDVADWYGVKCPRCGKSVIINRADMLFYKFMSAMVAIGRLMGIIAKPGKEYSKIRRVHIGSAFFRKMFD